MCYRLLILLLLTVAPTVGASTWLVDVDGSGDFVTIQDACDVAASGDTIRIGPGEFMDVVVDSGDNSFYIVRPTVEDLTFIGSGPATVIGPVDPDPSTQPPTRGISLHTDASGFRIENVHFRNLEMAIEAVGSTVVDNCRFFDCITGVQFFYPAGDCSVRHCQFEDCGTGIRVEGPCSGIAVSDCRFADGNGVYFDQTDNFEVSDCVFQIGPEATFSSHGIDMNYSQGVVRRCRLSGASYAQMEFLGGTDVVVDSCEIEGGLYNISAVHNARITGYGNVLRGAMEATVNLNVEATLDFESSHILRSSGYAIQIEYSYPDDDFISLDLSGNYWGTGSTDSLGAWIRDSNDDPELKYDIIYEPISVIPLDTKRTTAGGIRRLFR